MSLEFEPFAIEHIDEAAQLLAQRHRRDRLMEPELTARFEEADETRPLIQEALRTGLGVAASRSGRLVGYMIGIFQIGRDTRTVFVPQVGGAMAEGEDRDLIREMYAVVSARWLRRGFFVHGAELPASDAEALEAWSSLGFGREGVSNWRDTRAFEGSRVEVVIRRASTDDLDAVMSLAEGLGRYLAGPPIYAAFLPWAAEELDQARSRAAERLDDPAHSYWLACVEDRPVGLVSFRPPGNERILVPDNFLHLSQAFVEAASRAEGIGAALLDCSLAWVREQGKSRCTVGYASANIVAARFWQRTGFRPIAYYLERRIDPRIAWADGTNE